MVTKRNIFEIQRSRPKSGSRFPDPENPVKNKLFCVQRYCSSIVLAMTLLKESCDLRGHSRLSYNCQELVLKSEGNLTI